MLNGLRVKLDRYEAKAAHCQRAAQEATDEPGRAFYEELADYYGNLAYMRVSRVNKFFQHFFFFLRFKRGSRELSSALMGHGRPFAWPR